MRLQETDTLPLWTSKCSRHESDETRHPLETASVVYQRCLIPLTIPSLHVHMTYVFINKYITDFDLCKLTTDGSLKVNEITRKSQACPVEIASNFKPPQ